MPRRCAGIPTSAGPEYQRQLGQGGAADSLAGSGITWRPQSAAAKGWHERQRENRHRSRSRLAVLRVLADAERPVMSGAHDAGAHRVAITVAVTLAAFLESLDATIANGALP